MLYGILMTLFVFVTVLLALFVLIQQGKGDLGLGSMGGGGQMLFGGSGGKDFFERATWVLGAVFIFGALGLTLLRSKNAQGSRLAGYVSRKQQASSSEAAKHNDTGEQQPSSEFPEK